MTNLYNCFNDNLSGLIPLTNILDKTITINDCDFIVRPRTEKGWSIDIVFNTNNNIWVDNSIFYYWGISGATGSTEYLDNNLSFSFTSDNKIKWKTYKYIDENTQKIFSDKTESICSGITTDDFNITITFERNKELNECELLNYGGINDSIINKTVINQYSVLTGDTEIYEYTYDLGYKWQKEKYNRLGTLKIYINGKPFYKLKNWEEIVPCKRNTENNIIQTWGTGTTGCEDIHNGFCNFELKEINYYEEPLTFVEINKLFNLKSDNYNFNFCDNCSDNLNGNL